MGGSISRSINEDTFQIVGDNNATYVYKSATNVLLSVDTAVASNSCSIVKEAVKDHIWIGITFLKYNQSDEKI